MIKVQPDISFIERLRASTGSSLTTCMQCGACTAACELSADQEVFPRRQMIMAAWGMKDQLMADPFIWTCHQCGDCTESCPRGVKPGEILVALRKQQYLHYARPGFLARLLQKPAYLPLAIGFPAVIIMLILLLAGTFTIPEGEVDYSAFFPHAWLNGSFTLLFLLSTVGIMFSMSRFLKNMKAGQDDTGTKSGSRSFLRVILNILSHRDFNRCTEQRHRSLAHFLVLWGFVLLLFVTAFAILSVILFEYPLGFLNPIKIAGNTGAIMLLAGSSIMIITRILRPDKIRSDYTDWFFLGSFWLLTVSGILVEAARFLDWSSAYHLYFFHLVMVWIIIIFYPYTKFAHFLYRTIALVMIRRRP
jgi:quinone-modifying oxidoreductase subunit QmoC